MKEFAARLWAVALLTIREIYRKKYFLVLILFVIGIVSVFGLAPGLGPEPTLRVLETWIFRAVTFFIASRAVFIAGYSLPLEIERRQIYTLASKPIAKLTILLGKFVGFAIILAVSLAAMAITSGIILRTTQYVMSFSEPKEGEPATFSLHVYPHVDGEMQDSKTDIVEPRLGVEHLRVIGPRLDDHLEFRFAGLAPSDFEIGIPVRIRIRLGSTVDWYDLSSDLRLHVINPDTKTTEVIECPEVVSNEWYTPERFPSRTLIGRDGTLIVRIYRAAQDSYIQVSRLKAAEGKAGIQIFESPELFELSLAKGMTMVFLEGLFLLALTVAASSVMSGPVTLFLGISIFMVCSTQGFLGSAIEDVEHTLESYEREEALGHHHHHGEDIPPWILSISATVSKTVLTVLPDFNLHDPTPYLLDDLAVPPRAIWLGLSGILLHMIVCLAIGCLGISLRDFS
jgi:hypothetical protein